MLEYQVEQTQDDALLGRREIATFDPGVKASIATEQIVDHQEHQIGVEHEQGSATKRLDMNQFRLVGTGRLRMNSLYFWTLDGPNHDFGRAPHEAE